MLSSKLITNHHLVKLGDKMWFVDISLYKLNVSFYELVADEQNVLTVTYRC